MKSFSNFLLEKKPLDITNDPKGGEKFLKNLRKKSVQNQTDVKTVDRPADVQGRMDATDSKKGGYSRVDDSLDSKTTKNQKLGDTTKGGEVKTIRPPDSPSGNENRKLGKLDQKTGKLNFSSNKELQAKRKLRVDTKTGKATPKGVENYAQGRGGYGRTTGKPRNMPKPEWESRKAEAKQIASNPSSKAYKDIQKSIEGTRVKGREGVKRVIKSIPGKTSGKPELGKVKGYVAPSDYAGKRVKGASSTELKGIKSNIANSKTINAKSAPLNVPNKILGVKTNSKIIDTPKRRLKIVNKGVNQADVSKDIANQNRQYNINRTTRQTSLFPETEPKPGTKTQGFRTSSTSPQGASTPRSQRVSPGQGVLDFSKTNPPKPPTGVDITDLTKKSKVTSVLDNRKTDKLSSISTPPKPDKSNFTQGNKLVDKGFKQPPLSKTAKTFKDFASKLPKPVKAGGKLLGKYAGPAYTVYDGISNYRNYRQKGHGTTGSAVRSGVKAGSYWGGYAAGAAKGALAAAPIPIPGARIVGGLVGGALGGAAASKVSDMAINQADKTFKPKKVATKYQNPDYVKGVVAQKKKDKKPTGLSLGVSDKQWKARFGEEYVQERTRLKDRPQVQALRDKVKPFMNQGKVTVSSNNATGTPQPIQNNNTPVQTQKPVPTQTTQVRPLGPTQQAASNIDAMRSPASGSRKVQPGLIGKLLGNRGGSTPQTQSKPAVPQAQAQRPVAQAQQAKPAVPSQQARPGRTVGAPQGTGRPGAMVRVGSAINAVRSALSNKGPIQGRQTGAQRRVAQSQVRANRPAPVTPTRPIRGQGNRPIAGNQNRQGGTTPVAKPVTQAPVAKPVQAAPVAKPAPQLTGAQRAQQMAKQRIAQGRNTVTGELKSKPKVRKIASPMDMDY